MKRDTVIKIGLWTIAIFLALVCLRSGITKLPATSFWIRDFNRWHYPGWFRIAVGIAELLAAATLLVPRLASFGGVLFAIVMVGAIYTHATHNEFTRLPFNFLLLSLSIIVMLARRKQFQQNFLSNNEQFNKKATEIS